ncbi:hypothetical protein QWJ34_09255 [Saccharibacillus sp. CPCC 101409]|nr:hypothetical protein [Saccharibacillus sp. CPCC 101409]MDO3409947.1 hypothetical protein [Saccharibacillus sp. CPCC 101409]
MHYESWFIPLCVAVSAIFALAILTLSVMTLLFRARVNRDYDRGR